jgi:hypothetical protein
MEESLSPVSSPLPDPKPAERGNNWTHFVASKEIGHRPEAYEWMRERLFYHLVPSDTIFIKEVSHGCAFSAKFGPASSTGSLIGVTLRSLQSHNYLNLF